MTASLLKLPLRSHPAHPPPPGLRVEVQRLPAVDASRPLRLRFELAGGLATVRLPEPRTSAVAVRLDGLWRHTCFEAFVAGRVAASERPELGDPADRASAVGAAPYVEYNFSPSGAWAGYRFDRHREGMRAEPVVAAPRIVANLESQLLRVDVDLAWPVPLPGVGPAPAPSGDRWRGRLGLSAVVEAVDGSFSYWALHHPAAHADFHNGAGFTVEIGVPE